MPNRSKTTTTLLSLTAIVVLVGFPIRLYLAVDAAAISRDTVRFVEYARQLQSEPLTAIQQHDQHPLYPAMIAATHTILRPLDNLFPVLEEPVTSWSVAAVIPALLGGLGVIIAAYFLARVLFDHRVGLWAALLAALTAELCQLSADGLSDMQHLSVYLFALAAGIHGLQQKHFRWLAAAGCLSGLAYWIRPEGAEAAIAVAFGALFLVQRWAIRQRFIGAITVSLTAIFVAVPLMLMTGELIQKKSIEKLLIGQSSTDLPKAKHELVDKFEKPSRPVCSLKDQHKNLALYPAIQRSNISPSAVEIPKAVNALTRILENWARALRYTLLLPIIAWLIMRQCLAGRPIGQRVILFNLVLHWLILLALILHFDYLKLFSLRHVMILAGLTMPFSAAGLVVLKNTLSAKRPKLISAFLLVAMVVPTLPWLLETRHYNARAIRQAGEYIRSVSQTKPRILSDRYRSAYYANGQRLYLPEKCPPEKAVQLARRKNADFLVFERRRALAVHKDFFDEIENALRKNESIIRHDIKTPDDNNGSHVMVYRFYPRGASIKP